jgi:hypothetical protein
MHWSRAVLIAIVGLGFLASSEPTVAQPPSKTHRVGVLGNENNPPWEGFRQSFTSGRQRYRPKQRRSGTQRQEARAFQDDCTEGLARGRPLQIRRARSSHSRFESCRPRLPQSASRASRSRYVARMTSQLPSPLSRQVVFMPCWRSGTQSTSGVGSSSPTSRLRTGFRAAMTSGSSSRLEASCPTRQVSPTRFVAPRRTSIRSSRVQSPPTYQWSSLQRSSSSST